MNLRHSGSSVIHIRVGKVKIQHSFLIYHQPSLAYIFGIYSLINFVSASKHAYCKEVRNPVRILLNSLFSSHNSSFWTLQMSAVDAPDAPDRSLPMQGSEFIYIDKNQNRLTISSSVVTRMDPESILVCCFHAKRDYKWVNTRTSPLKVLWSLYPDWFGSCESSYRNVEKLKILPSKGMSLFDEDNRIMYNGYWVLLPISILHR